MRESTALGCKDIGIKNKCSRQRLNSFGSTVTADWKKDKLLEQLLIIFNFLEQMTWRRFLKMFRTGGGGDGGCKGGRIGKEQEGEKKREDNSKLLGY